MAGNAANVVLELVLVYGLDLGLDGSAAGTVLAQLGMGAAFAALLLRARGERLRPSWPAIRSLATIGAQIFVRSASLLACFLLAGAVAARAGAPSLAAHQVAFGIFTFLALVLDALAIAGQVLVGRALGSGDAAGARADGWRIIGWSLALGLATAFALAALHDVLPRAFSSDPDVLERSRAMWPLFVVLWPAAAVVFALDGILIGASDTRYLAGAMAASAAVFVPVVLVAGGLPGVWAALLVLMGARLLTTGVRFAGRRWALVGARARTRIARTHPSPTEPAQSRHRARPAPGSYRWLAHHARQGDPPARAPGADRRAGGAAPRGLDLDRPALVGRRVPAQPPDARRPAAVHARAARRLPRVAAAAALARASRRRTGARYWTGATASRIRRSMSSSRSKSASSAWRYSVPRPESSVASAST